MDKVISPEEQELDAMVDWVFDADQTDIPLDNNYEVDDDVVDDVVDIGKDDVRDYSKGEPADDFIVRFGDIGHQGDDKEDGESSSNDLV